MAQPETERICIECGESLEGAMYRLAGAWKDGRMHEPCWVKVQAKEKPQNEWQRQYAAELMAEMEKGWTDKMIEDIPTIQGPDDFIRLQAVEQQRRRERPKGMVHAS